MDERVTTTAGGPAWLSIREAAEYLQIGEPTLYRWMRDKKITFRKVGDSTRFLREDLDSFVQVFHSEREADGVKERCPLCNNPEFVEGRVRSTGLIYFQPKRAKFWTLKDSNITVAARMCSSCGAVFMFGDTSKLRSIVKDPKKGGGGQTPAQ